MIIPGQKGLLKGKLFQAEETFLECVELLRKMCRAIYEVAKMVFVVLNFLLEYQFIMPLIT